MSDVQDRIERLAAEARQRVDAAETQVAWQEGRAHGLREAAAITAAAADTRTLRDGVRGYIETLGEWIAAEEKNIQELAAQGVDMSYHRGSLRALLQASEDLRALLGGREEAGDE